jgi:hypothetical protein
LLSHVPTALTGGWVPAAVGESVTWSGEWSACVGRGRMLFSSAQGSPNNPALCEVATLLPVPFGRNVGCALESIPRVSRKVRVFAE